MSRTNRTTTRINPVIPRTSLPASAKLRRSAVGTPTAAQIPVRIRKLRKRQHLRNNSSFENAPGTGCSSVSGGVRIVLPQWGQELEDIARAASFRRRRQPQAGQVHLDRAAINAPRSRSIQFPRIFNDTSPQITLPRRPASGGGCGTRSGSSCRSAGKPGSGSCPTRNRIRPRSFPGSAVRMVSGTIMTASSRVDPFDSVSSVNIPRPKRFGNRNRQKNG